LKKKGYKEVKVLADGIAGWKKEHMPLVMGRSSGVGTNKKKSKK